MMSAVIQDNEESVGPLADGEVARLLSALHNAEFTRSDKHDLAKNSKFRPRSLIEIAAEAKNRGDAIEPYQDDIAPNIDSDSSQLENFSNAKSDSLRNKSLEAVKTNELAPEQTIRDITSREKNDDQGVKPDLGVRGLTTNSNSISETDGTEPGIRGLTTNSNSISETDGTEPGIRGLTTNSNSISETERTEPGIRGLTTNSNLISETDGTEPGIRGLTTNSNSISETDETGPGIRGLTSVPHGDTEVPETAQVSGELTSSSSGGYEETAQNSFETVNEAFERGKKEGVSEGRLAAIAETEERAIADAKGELAGIVDTFNNVIESLARPKAMQVEALSSSIHTTILKLASERAGMQIDELPASFYERINALLSGITQELAEGKVHLNEADYVAMKPYLTNLGCEVVANSNLMRGDVTIKFDGVEVHDVAANRMVGHSASPSDGSDATAAAYNIADNTADENGGLENISKGDELPPPSDEQDP